MIESDEFGELNGMSSVIAISIGSVVQSASLIGMVYVHHSVSLCIIGTHRPSPTVTSPLHNLILLHGVQQCNFGPFGVGVMKTAKMSSKNQVTGFTVNFILFRRAVMLCMQSRNCIPSLPDHLN